jgi:adenosylcobinamide-GDP ribazoletransferase
MPPAPAWLRDLVGAWIFYSVLPAWPWPQPSFERIARFAPWIGFVIGGLQAGMWWLLSGLGWPQVALVPVVLAFGLWLTGGLHLDGLVDTGDGLAAGPEHCLEAMEDSRIGASGVQLLVLVLLLQFAALVRLGPMVPMALIVASALARVSPLWAMARFAYLRVNGTAGFHRKHHKGLGEAVPTLILLVLGSPLLKQLPLLSVPICVLCSILVAEWLGRRLGGMTGDGYGAVVMLSETFILLLMALLAPLVGSGGG